MLQPRMDAIPKQIAPYFVPSCTGEAIQTIEKGSIVDVVGKLMNAQDVRSVSSPGKTEDVCNARIMFTDKLAIPIGFWGHHAKKAKSLEGKVVACFGCYVSVSAVEDKKSVNLRAKGSGRIEFAQPAVRDLCAGFEDKDVERDAIPSFEPKSKPVTTDAPGFRTSLEYLAVCSEKEFARLQHAGGPTNEEEVTWEIKGVTIQVDHNKCFNNEQELWMRFVVKDHTTTREIQATDEVIKSLTNIATMEEIQKQAKDRSLVIKMGVYNIKGVTRWTKTSGMVNYTIGEWAPYDFTSRFSSIDKEVALHRVQMEYPSDSVLLPAAYKFMVQSGKQALNMKLPNGGLHSASQFLMWVHMPGQTEHKPYGAGVCLENTGVYCKVSEGMDSASIEKTFDMVYFSQDMNAAFVLNEDSAIVIVSDVLKQGEKCVLVVDYVKKVKEREAAAVNSHFMQYFTALWQEGDFAGSQPLLKPEDMILEERAKRAKVVFTVPDSPAVKKKDHVERFSEPESPAVKKKKYTERELD